MLIYYNIIQLIYNIRTGAYIVRSSPVNPFLSAIKGITNVAKTSANFTLSTGITFALCYELDEILISEGKQPYFVPGMKQAIKSAGGEDLAKKFLNKIGIKDRIDLQNSENVSQVMATMNEEEKKTS